MSIKWSFSYNFFVRFHVKKIGSHNMTVLQDFRYVRTKNLIFLFLNQNICCGYSKEPSQRDGSVEHPKNMLKLINKNIFIILRSRIVFI